MYNAYDDNSILYENCYYFAKPGLGRKNGTVVTSVRIDANGNLTYMNATAQLKTNAQKLYRLRTVFKRKITNSTPPAVTNAKLKSKKI